MNSTVANVCHVLEEDEDFFLDQEESLLEDELESSCKRIIWAPNKTRSKEWFKVNK